MIRAIPILLMVYAFVCALLFGSPFLVNNVKLLTLIDTVLFVIATIDIARNYSKYIKTAVNCYFGCLAFLFLERTDIVFTLSDKVYLSLYYFIIFVVVVKSVIDNKRK